MSDLYHCVQLIVAVMCIYRHSLQSTDCTSVYRMDCVRAVHLCIVDSRSVVHLHAECTVSGLYLGVQWIV